LRGMVFSGPVTLAKEMMAGDFSFLGRMGLLGWASAAASLCAGAAGIAGGILLLGRRRLALRLHWVYGLARIAAVLSYMGMYLTLAEDLPREYRGIWLRTVYAVGTGEAMQLFYPIFVLAWFSRLSVILHMEGWRTPAGRAASRPAGPIWPTVLGAMGTFWASLELLSAAHKLLGMVLPFLAEPAAIHFVHMAVFLWVLPGAALSAMSLIWGVLLLRRRRSAMPWCIVQAACWLVWTASFPLMLTMTGSFPGVAIRLDWIVGMTASSVVSAIWPVFLLVWFTRPGIRAQVRSWGRGTSPVILEVPS